MDLDISATVVDSEAKLIKYKITKEAIPKIKNKELIIRIVQEIRSGVFTVDSM